MNQKTFVYDTDGSVEVNAGDEVVLVSRYHENTGVIRWGLLIAPDGVGGNMNNAIKRYHGWRGTTNNISLTAHGLRKVLKIEDIDDYAGTLKLTVGKDLHPDWD